MPYLRERLYTLLRWSERYTKTDMVYLFRSGFWSNLGAVHLSLFSFALYITFAHFLPPETYGTYQYLLSLSVIVGAFTLTGMNNAVVRAVAQGYEGSLREAVAIQLRWNLLPFAGSCAFAAYYFLHGNAILGGGLILIGLGTPLINTFNTAGAYVAGKKDFRRGFFFNLFASTLYYGAVIAVAYASGAALVLLAANLISQFIGFFIVYRWTLRVYKPGSATDRAMASYGGHLSIMNLLATVIGQMDSVLAFHYLGPATLATYSFATALPDRAAGLFKFVSSAAFPKFAVKTNEEIRRSLFQKTAIAVVAGVVMACVYVLIARPFFIFFFPAYIQAVPYSQVYALIIIFSIVTVFPAALTAQQRTKDLYVFNIATPLVQLVLQVGGIIWFGLWGLIWAKIFYWLFYGLLGFILTVRTK